MVSGRTRLTEHECQQVGDDSHPGPNGHDQGQRSHEPEIEVAQDIGLLFPGRKPAPGPDRGSRHCQSDWDRRVRDVAEPPQCLVGDREEPFQRADETDGQGNQRHSGSDEAGEVTDVASRRFTSLSPPVEDDDPAVDQQIGPVCLLALSSKEAGKLADCGQERDQEDELDDGQVDRPSRGRWERLPASSLATPQQVGDWGGDDEGRQGAGEFPGGAPDEAVGGQAGPGQGGRSEPGRGHGEGKDEIRDEIETTLFLLSVPTSDRPNHHDKDPGYQDQEEETGQREGQDGISQIWSQ